MELAIKTLERKIKELKPFCGKRMNFAGQVVLIDDVVEQHQKAIEIIQSRIDLIKAVEELKKHLPENESKVKSEIKQIADEFSSGINETLIKTVEQFSSDPCENCLSIICQHRHVCQHDRTKIDKIEKNHNMYIIEVIIIIELLVIIFYQQDIIDLLKKKNHEKNSDND